MEIIFFSVLGKNASIRSKLPTDLNIELHLLVEAKESLQSVDFHFLALMRSYHNTNYDAI